VNDDLELCLQPTHLIDSDSQIVIDKAIELTHDLDTTSAKAQRLFYYVRDSIGYNPYVQMADIEAFQASIVMQKGKGFCIHKAIVLAALARVVGIPSKLVFANIKNHRSPEKLMQLMKTDLFVYHGYTELYVDGKWLKVTPSFDLALCEENDIIPTEFDGKNHAVLHKYDRQGRLHIEYITYHGSFADVPIMDMLQAWSESYGHMLGNVNSSQ